MPSPLRITATFVLLSLPLSVTAQTPKQLQLAFAALRSDNIPGNALEAQRFLFQRSDNIKDQLLGELYRTDRQARDAILLILFSTKAFVPDDRFARFILARMSEHDKYVRSSDLLRLADGDAEYSGVAGSAHVRAWKFIDTHFPFFSPFLIDQITTTKDVRTLWSIAFILKKHRLLQRYLDVFTPEVLARAAENLRDDEIDYNASQAARLFLILGVKGIPILHRAENSTDLQQKNVARALINAINKGDFHDLLGGELEQIIDPGYNPWGSKD